jgi:hypothetical protein
VSIVSPYEQPNPTTSDAAKISADRQASAASRVGSATSITCCVRIGPTSCSSPSVISSTSAPATRARYGRT